jgi:hypothetical protein
MKRLNDCYTRLFTPDSKLQCNKYLNKTQHSVRILSLKLAHLMNAIAIGYLYDRPWVASTMPMIGRIKAARPISITAGMVIIIPISVNAISD